MESKQAQLKNVLANIASEIQGTVGISIVQLSSGMPLASISNKPNFNLDVAAAYNAEVVKQKQKALQALSLQNEKLEEFIITLTSQIHVIRFIDTDHIIYLVVESANSNLGIIRVVVNKNAPKIAEIMKSFG